MGNYANAREEKKTKILPGKWVYDMKSDNTGTVTEYRARWVICSNRQQPGLDFGQNHASITAAQSVKLLYALASRHDLKLGQFDVIAAYLNAAIDQ